MQQTLYPLPRTEPKLIPDQSKALNPKYLTTSQDTYRPILGGEIFEMYQPDWVKMDRHVLRFVGFFKESVVESRIESSRVRALILFYYLEDNTICITEKKFENSGIPQGPFLKRQKFMKPDKSFLTPYELIVGESIEIYGKKILVCDCDQYTKEFYEVKICSKLEFGNKCPRPNRNPRRSIF